MKNLDFKDECEGIRKSKLKLILILLFAFSVLISGSVIFFQSRESATPILVAEGNGKGGFVDDDFTVYQPDVKTAFVPSAILRIIRVKENVHPVGNQFPSAVGTLRTLPFVPSRYMAIPVFGSGFKEALKPRVFLRCLGNGAEIDLLNAPTQDWSIYTLHLSKSWWPGEAQIIGTSTDDATHVGIGTPVKIGPLYWMMSRQAGIIAAGFVVCFLFMALTLPILALSKYNLLGRLAAVVIYPSIAGYTLYMIGWFANPGYLLSCTALLYFIFPSLFFFGRYCFYHEMIDQKVLSHFLTGTAGVLIIIVLPYFVIPIKNGVWFPAFAFYPASWSTDNLMSILMAKSLLFLGGRHPEFMGVGGWSISDRGIIQAGTFTAPLSLPKIKYLFLESAANIYAVHIYGALLQGLAIPVGAVFICDQVKGKLKPVAVTALLASTPFFLMNIFYIWPKLSGGLLIVVSLIALWHSLREGSAVSLCLAIMAFFLASMNHSANIFAAPAFLAYIFISLCTGHHNLYEIRRLARAGFLPATFSLMLGLGLEQGVTMLDPKSSWPILYLLTGTGTFGLDENAIVKAVKLFYESMTFEQYIHMRIEDLKDILWLDDAFFARNYFGFSLAAIRGRQFFSLIPSLGPGLIFIAVFSLFARSSLAFKCKSSELSSDTDLPRTIVIFGASCIINLIFFILAFNMPMVLHHLPYGLIEGLIFAIICMSLEYPRLFFVSTALQIINSSIVWFYGSAHLWDTLAKN